MNRSEILQKLSTGEISVEEATRLLEGQRSQPEPEAEKPQEPEAARGAAKETSPQEPTKGIAQAKWLHVRVSDSGSDKDRVRVNIPIGVLRAGAWFGSRWAAKFGFWDDVVDALDRGAMGTLVEVEDIESGERVHIYVD